jgi:ABC-type transport system involved in cytochrome bd biosynthesis fused ATPase/permease subunit
VLIKSWFDTTKSPSLIEVPREISIRILKEIVYVHQNPGITTQSIDEDVTIADETALQQCLLNAFQ